MIESGGGRSEVVVPIPEEDISLSWLLFRLRGFCSKAGYLFGSRLPRVVTVMCFISSELLVFSTAGCVYGFINVFTIEIEDKRVAGGSKLITNSEVSGNTVQGTLLVLVTEDRINKIDSSKYLEADRRMRTTLRFCGGGGVLRGGTSTSKDSSAVAPEKVVRDGSAVAAMGSGGMFGDIGGSSRVSLTCVGLYSLMFASMWMFLPAPNDFADEVKGNVWLAFRVTLCVTLIGACSWDNMLGYAVIVHDACQRHDNGGLGEGYDALASVANVDDSNSSEAVVAVAAPPAGIVHLNPHSPEVQRVTRRWTAQYFVLMLATCATTGGASGITLAQVLMFGVAIFYTLPRAADVWCPGGGGRRLVSFVRRAVLVGVPLALLPRVLLPSLIKNSSADAVVVWWPWFISFAEHVAVVWVFNDKVVKGHSDEAVCIIARWAVAIFEGNRLGLVIAVANSPMGSTQALLLSTVTSSVLEALARNDLINIWAKQLANSGVLCCRKTDLSLKRMGRFDKIYLGCKVDTEYWGPLSLLLMLLFNFGYPVQSAMDPDTGELVPVLRCGADVLLVVVGGEVLADFLAVVFARAVARWTPHLVIDTPRVLPGTYVLTHVAMWLNVGLLFTAGIGSMGALSDALHEDGVELTD